MLRRKVESKLIEWKERKDHKALLVEGARQIGKSYSISKFGNENYDEFININFKITPDISEVFSGTLDIDTVLLGLRFRFQSYKFEEGKTLIFLDEVQECPEAITALKFFTIDGRFDVIASGSLLGIDYKRPSSYPVGYVEYLKMYALDFEEFLWSQNIGDDMISSLRMLYDQKSKVPIAVNNNMMSNFRKYIAVGGMPEAVQRFVDSGFYEEPDRVQRELITGYKYDIAHFAPAVEKIKAEQCYDSMSKQLLGKENHKFQYKVVSDGGSSRKYYSSVDWLITADMAFKSTNLSALKYNPVDYEDESNFRLYTNDVGLLIGTRDYNLKKEIIENSVTGATRGGLYECAIADILIKKGYKLHFYRNDQRSCEIDFVIAKDGAVVPIEVKSGNNRATSLKRIMSEDKTMEYGIKLMDGNIVVSEEGIITLPIYMAMFL